MLTLWGAKHRFCDGLNRRDFLRVGALGIGGLTLPDLLRLQAQAGSKGKHKAVIMVCLAGGPSHIDMYDLKPGAPDNIRGEFKPIQSKVPGFDICELMPLQTTIADKLALVRTVQFVEPMQHELEEVYTGFTKAAHRPSFGSVISRFHTGTDPRVPRYVCLDYGGDATSYESPQYLGAAHRPFVAASNTGGSVRNLSLSYGMTINRLHDRKKLADQLDTLRRDIDQANTFNGLDAFSSQAIDMITSTRAREAFDLSKEPDRVRQRYGTKNDKYTYVSRTLDNIWPGESFLLARRLVEAGVSAVTFRVGSWDHHGNVFSENGNIWNSLRTVLPFLDRSIHTLVTDLHERGLDKDVLVLVWGEFGRTPRISQGGRDHWPDLGYALFAGGGLKTGLVVGDSDSHAARPKNRPLNAQNVLATIYHHFGIEPKQTVPDFSGRPQYLLEDGEPIGELVS
jgi:hypothetical protein